MGVRPSTEGIAGHAIWHRHTDIHELFVVLGGPLTIQLRDRSLELEVGELFVDPGGVEHRRRADVEMALLLIESVGAVKPGEAGAPHTAEPQRP